MKIATKLLCLNVSLVLSVCTANAQNLAPGHAEFVPLSPQLELKILRSFVNNERPSVGLLKNPDVGDEKMYSLWRSNRVDWSARVDKVNLMFSPDPLGAGDQAASNDSFGVQLSYDQDDKHIVVRSDSPATQRYLGGLRFAFSPERGWAAILPGKSGRSLLVAVARLSAEQDKAAFVCPYEGGTQSKAATPAAANMNYKLAGASFDVSAHALAKVQSGSGPGWARASILTSPQVFSTQEFQDEAFMRDPKVNIEYTADKEEKLEQPTNVSDYMGGVRVQIFLQSNPGYIRESVNEQVVWVRRFSNDLSISALSQGSQIEVKPKECILVLKAGRLGHTYSKAALIEPTPVPTALALPATPSAVP